MSEQFPNTPSEHEARQAQPRQPRRSRSIRRAVGAAAGIVGLGVGVTLHAVDTANRHDIENNLRTEREQSEAHTQAILDEIEQKSTQLFEPGEQGEDSMVAFLGPVGDTDLYGQAISAIPDDLKEDGFVKYTVIESSKNQYIYQAEDEFALVATEIDGRDTLIVRQVDPAATSVASELSGDS